MGIFDGLFSKNTIKAAEKQLAKEEKDSIKWPSKFYGNVLGVYLTGELNYYYADHGNCRWQIYKFPDWIDHKKAIDLCRAAADPKNVKKMQSHFGKQWSDPGDRLRMYLVGLLSDGEEREQLIRNSWNNNYAVAYYIYRMGWVDKYCKTIEDKLVLYDLIARNPEQAAEQRFESNYGVQRWLFEEMFGSVPFTQRRKQGYQEIAKLLKSKDPAEREAAERFIKLKVNKDQSKITEYQKTLLDLHRFVRDEMDAVFVDPKTGKKYRMNKDDTFEEIHD